MGGCQGGRQDKTELRKVGVMVAGKTRQSRGFTRGKTVLEGGRQGGRQDKTELGKVVGCQGGRHQGKTKLRKVSGC